jgi:cell division septum initiation protein DivIVA
MPTESAQLIEDIHDQLEDLQAKREALTKEIRAIQHELAAIERQDAIRRHLDSLPLEDQGVLIRIAAARLGQGPGQSI